ncbi:MAG: WG repeat-containing protein, partial [Bacteroidales bacterium]|nr:WG repeat-containing protein [Bacteroidales bacterium]
RWFKEGLAAVNLRTRYHSDQWGFVDKTGAVVIPPQYIKVMDFSEGMAQVKVGGKWGYLDKTGQIAIAAQYDRTENFSEGLAKVQVGEKYGFINQKGQMVIAPQYSSAEDFSEGLAAVRIDDKAGFIDHTGQFAIEPRFDFSHSFSEGFAEVSVNGLTGYIDKRGQYIVPLQKFNLTEPFSEGLAAVRLDESKNIWCFFDTKGKKVFTVTGVTPWDFSGGLSKLERELITEDDGVDFAIDYINKRGEYVWKEE